MKRVAWEDDETFAWVVEGVESVDVVIRDGTHDFSAFGAGGKWMKTDDPLTGWDAADTLANVTFKGGAAAKGRHVVVGTGGTIGLRDEEGSASFACVPSGTRNQTTWHTPCTKPSGTPTMYGVARYEASRFIAVGANLTVWTTTAQPGHTHPWYPRTQFEYWNNADVPSSGLFSAEGRYADTTPDLFDVARVGAGVVAVGAEGTVLARKAGQSSWKRLDLGEETWGWTLRGVAVDDVNEWVFRDDVEDEYQDHQVAAVVVVGLDGVAAWFRIDWAEWDDAFAAIDITWMETPPWGEVNLMAVTVDERSRIVAGASNTLWVQPHEELWDNEGSWVDRNPNPGTGEDYLDVASDGRVIVAVGTRTNTAGVVWAGVEDVRECHGEVTWVREDGVDTDAEDDDALTVVVDLDELSPSADCTPEDWGDVTVVGEVWPVFAHGDPRRTRVEPSGVSLVGSALSFGAQRVWDDDGVWDVGPLISSEEARGVDPRLWRVNLVEDLGGGDLRHYRVTLTGQNPQVPEDPTYPTFGEIVGWLRYPQRAWQTDGPAYPLGDIPFPDYEGTEDEEFVEVLFGVLADESGNDYLDRRKIIGDHVMDYCGEVPLSPLATWMAVPGCSADDMTDCILPLGDRDPTDDPDNDVIDYISAVGRYRAGTGHPFVDYVESQDEGMAWRYMAMKHYFWSRCDHPVYDVGGTPCSPLGEEECYGEEETDAPALDGAWEAQCCGETDLPDQDRAPRIGRLPLYAPFAGMAAVYGPTDLKFRQKGQSVQHGVPIEDDCAVYDAEGEWRSPNHTVDIVDSLYVMNEAGNLAIRIDHVESCLFDPIASTLPPTTVEDLEPLTDNTTWVPVRAGDRIGMAVSHKQFDIIVFIKDDTGAWRLMSYFDLLPTGLYNLYRQQLRFGPRNTDPGWVGYGAVDDPIISLDDVDACPLGPGHSEEPPDPDTDTVDPDTDDPEQDIVIHADFSEQRFLELSPGTTYCEDNGADQAMARRILLEGP